MNTRIRCGQALTSIGWMEDCVITIGDDGRIAGVEAGGTDSPALDHHVDVLLPGMANVHSHSFQHAMAGLAETKGPGDADDFWSWRRVMYQFLEVLTPDDIEVIGAYVQMRMAEAGYTAQGEFHYVHHAADGTPYDDIAETSLRHLSAAGQSGIGLAHLPVLYRYAGLDKAPLAGGQRRFGCDLDQFARLHQSIAAQAQSMPADFALGVAPHSIRAADAEGISHCQVIVGEGPLHIHIAEQMGEVEEALVHLGARPVRWLLDNFEVGAGWCLIHATHLSQGEITDMARSRAVAGLCPTTEGNLGDGIFPARQFMAANGAIAIGSDSHIRISLTEELRLLEISQRLRDCKRVLLADDNVPSVGRYLYQAAATGGAQSIGRQSGTIEVGQWADLTALNVADPLMEGLRGDQLIDAWIFAGNDSSVCDVWSAGRHIVSQGRHIRREAIESKFRQCLHRLRAQL